MKRKISSKPTRIWKFAAKIVGGNPVACEILWRSNRYYNRLVEIERARGARFSAARRRYAPELAELEDRWIALDEQVLIALYRESKGQRQDHWRESGGEKVRLLAEQFEARRAALEDKKKAVSAEAKAFRLAFASLLAPAREAFRERATARADGGGPRIKSAVNTAVLAEMLAESEWSPAWKEIARSDDIAHWQSIEARSLCGLYCGTYLGVEESFARAKKDSSPRPPRFKRFDPSGKIQMQLKCTYGELGAETSRIRFTRLPARPGASPRSNMFAVDFDQSLRSDAERSVVQVIAKLHRLPPDDADVKWAALLLRRVGQRTICELQLTLEHESFAESKRPAGERAPEHVAIGWTRSAGGIRVAHWPGGEIVCPNAIIEQKEHGESIKSFVDALYEQAQRRLRKLQYGQGNRWSGMLLRSDRARSVVRRICEQYAEHTLGAESVRERWRVWIKDRRSRGEDLYAPMRVIRKTMNARDAVAWWCWIWARKDAHLCQLAIESSRRFANRRDAHYRSEAIRVATEFESVTVDKYSIAALKQLEPITMPGEGVRDMGQSQLQASAPGRLREILIEVMGPRCTPCDRPGVQKKPGGARARKSVKKSITSESIATVA